MCWVGKGGFWGGDDGPPKGGRTDKKTPSELGCDRTLSPTPSSSHSCLCPSPLASLCLGPAVEGGQGPVFGGCSLPLGETDNLSS